MKDLSLEIENFMQSPTFVDALNSAFNLGVG